MIKSDQEFFRDDAIFALENCFYQDSAAKKYPNSIMFAMIQCDFLACEKQVPKALSIIRNLTKTIALKIDFRPEDNFGGSGLNSACGL